MASSETMAISQRPQQQQQQQQQEGEQEEDQQPQQQQQQQHQHLRSDTEFSIATLPPPATETAAGLSPRQGNDLSYMHRPPAIMPNYGKKSRGSVLPKSNVSRVLLYDNITQQTMLDVRLNSIQSQSHKTHRELDMHMKSFISRRKARQKALKKLTRVQHYDDYVTFQQDHEREHFRQKHHQFANVADCYDGGEDPSRLGHRSRFLPEIRYRSTSVQPRASHPKLHQSDNDEDHEKLLHEDKDATSLKLESSSSALNDLTHQNDTINTESLPQIPLSAPGSLARKAKVTVGKYQALDQDKRIGYRLIKGQNGHTRIFHSLPEPEDDQSAYESPSPLRENDSPRPQKLLPLRRGLQNRRPRIKHIKRKEMDRKQFLGSPMIQNESFPDQGERDNQEEPLSDFRFLHLRQILIPQDPPNEGYTELSPSYPRHYPALKDVVVTAKKYKKRKRVQENGGVGGIGNGDIESAYSGEGSSSNGSDLDEDIVK